MIIAFILNYIRRKLQVSEVYEKQKKKNQMTVVLLAMLLQDLCRWSVQVCLCRTVWICRTAWLPPPRGCVWEAFAPEWHEGWWAVENQRKLEDQCNETSDPSWHQSVFLQLFSPLHYQSNDTNSKAFKWPEAMSLPGSGIVSEWHLLDEFKHSFVFMNKTVSSACVYTG